MALPFSLKNGNLFPRLLIFDVIRNTKNVLGFEWCCTMKKLLFSFVFLGCTLLAFAPIKAQNYDSLQQVEEQILKDSIRAMDKRRADSMKIVRKQRKVRKPMSTPLRAALLSAAIPGAGQIYNKSLWYVRVPIIYGLFGFLAYNVKINQDAYVAFRDNHLYSRDGNPLTIVDPKYALYDANNLKTQRDRFLRERDFNIIMLLVVYGLNMAEAAATAHLKKFDVSDDLSLQFKPKFMADANMGMAAGISLTFTFK